MNDHDHDHDHSARTQPGNDNSPSLRSTSCLQTETKWDTKLVVWTLDTHETVSIDGLATMSIDRL